ncbi:hypothetical protein [Methylobacterium sp. Leaf118]|uniref:hypothetical protein n=1 Tax=Methylobacterium sp. Leaf118 TaxID=2876562 RepID=UPI001E58471E|nr:hypothetical protein [Methylobacterium sp. Leaf118]
MPRRACFAAALGLLLAGQGPAFAQSPEPPRAEQVLAQVMKARGDLNANCKIDILRESPLGDLPCRTGTRTAVEAWDEALTGAGLPGAERDGIADRLGLTPGPEDDKAGIWRADPRDVARLIATLRLKAGG